MTAGQPIDPGREIAPGYVVLAHMRRGNDLDVYDAWSRERMSRVIVKAVRPDRTHRERTRDALRLEGELLTRFTHPHIVRAYEFVEDPTPALVLETLTGQTLAHLIESTPTPQREEVAHLGLQLGSALHYMHARGFLHLDVKPSNVIAEGARAKLIDLSLARAPGPVRPGTGTWHYLSPEQARGDVLTAAADAWGLGATLFEAATGQAPFDDDADAWATVSSRGSMTLGAREERYPQLERRARSVADVTPIDIELAAVIDDCLEPDVTRRLGLHDLMGALEHLAGVPGPERWWAPERTLSAA
jgi:serine/threonine protein kinase